MRIASSVVLCMAVLSGVAPPARAEVTAEQVREAIERAVGYLEREQHPDGSWPDPPGYPGGVTALVTLALLNAGVTPDDGAVKDALNYLRKIPPTMTYATALQTMVFCAAEPKSNLKLIQRNAAWLQENQKQQEGTLKGAWGYPMAEGDNSNAQFALLALHEAERAGVSINERTWRLALNYWQSVQNPDGSFGYKPGNSGTGSMTCAGIAALLIANDRPDAADARLDDGRVQCCGQQENDRHLENALLWLGRNFRIAANPGQNANWWLYYLYGVERVGRLSNQRFIGEHDWYREGAEYLVQAQDPLSGYWKGVGHGEDNAHVATSFALLFLAKGRRPVLAAKLKHAPLDDWNHHRHDLFNLTSYVETRWKRDLTWQVIDSRQASVDDLLEAPVLFLSGEMGPEFSDEEVRRLREYVNRGGFIFAEKCCGGDDFDQGFRRLMKRMFPEPEYALRLLPPDHPAYGAEERIDPEFFNDPQYQGLEGVDVGCRTSVIYVPMNVSCFWELARPGRDQRFPKQVQLTVDSARSLGINVLAYATNREVKYKLDAVPTADADAVSDRFERAQIQVAQIKHNGGSSAAPGALMNLLRTLQQQTGLRVDTERHEVALSDPRLFGYPVLFFHGRTAFRLSDGERAQLRKYVERGGVVFGDAVCGSEQFAESFRREMAAVFPDNSLKPIPANHPMFTSELGGFDLESVSRRDPQRRGADGPLKAAVHQVAPEFEGIKLHERYQVIFSRYDISCALERHESIECPGYVREDAARLGLNIVLYALHQ